jgi:glutamate synthase (NADPH/NADH) small chain
MKAIGQVLVPAPVQNGVNDVLELERGRIAVNADYQTSLSNVWAGGDCVGTRLDLTVQAVEDGKRAAAAIDRALQRSA